MEPSGQVFFQRLPEAGLSDLELPPIRDSWHAGDCGCRAGLRGGRLRQALGRTQGAGRRSHFEKPGSRTTRRRARLRGGQRKDRLSRFHSPAPAILPRRRHGEGSRFCLEMGIPEALVAGRSEHLPPAHDGQDRRETRGCEGDAVWVPRMDDRWRNHEAQRRPLAGDERSLSADDTRGVAREDA